MPDSRLRKHPDVSPYIFDFHSIMHANGLYRVTLCNLTQHFYMFLHVVMVVMVHHAVAHIIGDATLGYGGVSAASGCCFLRTSYERRTRVSGDVHVRRLRRSPATMAAIFKRFGLRLRGVLPWASLGHSRTGLRRPHPQPE